MDELTDELIPTRATLLQRLRNWRDDASWQDFFDTYWRLIFNTARKAGLSREEAQDVVQETLFTVAKHMPKFKYDPAVGSFKGWLLKTTRWRILGQLRKRGLLSKCSTYSDDNAYAAQGGGVAGNPTSDELDAQWNSDWEVHLFEAAVMRVKRRSDPQKYQIFDCCVNKGWKAAKIARTFRISIEQVYRDKYRVTEMIKEEVKRLERGVT